MNALDDYKRKSGRMFPTCSEVLEVIYSLGYVKLSPSGRALHDESALQRSRCSAESEWAGIAAGWVGHDSGVRKSDGGLL